MNIAIKSLEKPTEDEVEAILEGNHEDYLFKQETTKTIYLKLNFTNNSILMCLY